MNPKPILSEKEHSECRERDDISFVPLAMPIIAGPGAIAVLLTNASHLHSDGESVYFWGLGMLAVLIVAITTWACFRCATIVHTCLGASGLKAMTRIVGFILICIAAQMMIDGVVGLIHEHFPDVTEVLG